MGHTLARLIYIGRLLWYPIKQNVFWLWQRHLWASFPVQCAVFVKSQWRYLSTLSKLRAKRSFSSSESVFWNGRMWSRSICSNSLSFSFWPLKTGTWVFSSFVMAWVLWSRPGRSVMAAITSSIFSSDITSDSSSGAM